jgi:pimeloyl-ACP methyl ester carboxylesterase
MTLYKYAKKAKISSIEKQKTNLPFHSNPFVSEASINPFLPTPELQCNVSEALAAQVARDAPYEQLAHRYVYQNDLSPTDIENLAKLGYQPQKMIHASQSLDMQLFVPMNDSGTPVLAFRGSKEALDWIHDANPSGVGIAQFDENIKVIENLLRSVDKVDVTGHSLGGALAQYTAVAFPEKVRRVVTFQSPGIPASRLKKLIEYNAQSKNPIESTHYRNRGDIVDDAGEAFTPGEALTFDHAMNPATAHTDYILENYHAKNAPPNPKGAPAVTVSPAEGIGSFRPAETARQNLLTPNQWEALRTAHQYGTKAADFVGNTARTAVDKTVHGAKSAVRMASRLVDKLKELKGK